MTKPTDWRKTCAELIENVRYLIDCVDRDCFDPVALMECREHLSQTRTALVQPEPEGVGLSDDAIEADFRSWYNDRYHHHYFGAIPLVECIEWTREALTRYTLAQPEPEGVGDEEIAECLIAAGVDAVEAESHGTKRMYFEGWYDHALNGVRAAIAADRARLAHFARPTIKPVPGAEAQP